MSYGYGLSASLFQLAQAYHLCHHGTLTPVTMLKRGGLEELDSGSPQYQRPPSGFARDRVGQKPTDMPAATRCQFGAPRHFARHRASRAQDVVDGGRPRQHCPKAQAVGYSVGARPGTAHKQEGRGYSGSKYRAWFVGIAPINKPRIVVAVMVDEPGNGVYYGGEVAAPCSAKWCSKR